MTAPAAPTAAARRRAWLMVAVWAVFQLTLTSLPGSALPPQPEFRIDWVAHFGIYFGLGFLFARAWLLSNHSALGLVWAWLAIATFGALDELHETLIPGRGMEFMDWLMDVVGGNCGLAIGTLMMRHRWAAKYLR